LFVALVAAAVLSQVLHGALAWASDVANANLQSRVEQDVRIQIFDQFMDFNYADARKHKLGELSSHMDQVNFLGMTINRMHEMVQQMLLLVVYTGLLFWLSWQATLISMAAMLVLSVAMRSLVRKVRRAGEGYKNSVVSVTQQAVEFLNGLRVIQTFGREDYARDSVRTSIDDCSRSRRRGLIWHATIAPVIQSVSVIVVGAILAVGYAVYGQADRAALIGLTSFVLVIFRTAPRVSQLNKTRGLLAQYMPFLERIALLLSVEGKTKRVMGTRAYDGLREKVEFVDVTFAYPETESQAVQNLDFTLRRGQMTALVGESGAGKTTIADLLLGLYRVSSGKILVDGVPLHELDWNHWRRHLGVVGQETFRSAARSRQHRIRQARRDRRGDRSCIARRARARFHHPARGRLCDGARRAGLSVVGRSKTSSRDRPRDPARSPDLDPRRGYE
jgi:ABC-type multidrug transport system fused ATPase/permease subunit